MYLTNYIICNNLDLNCTFNQSHIFGDKKMREVYSKDIQELAGECAVRELFTQVKWRFRQLEENGGFTKAELGPRSQISRWLDQPSNMTLRTAAKMLMAMGVQLKLTVSLPPPIS
jgi:hypothetical protein